MKLQRLLQMNHAELAIRCRQQAFKTIGRLTAPEGETSPVCQLDNPHEEVELARIISLLSNGGDKLACDLIQNRLRKLAPSRFFAGASNNAVCADIASDNPELRQQIINHADAVCDGKFGILGYGSVSFGTPVNWHSEPLTGLTIPLLHWSKLNPLLKTQVGDSKVVWELNRHQWLLDLGQAWRFTGDERYAQTSIDLIASWMRANPPGLGINWSSSLEVSLRLISWCWALLLFDGSKALTPEFLFTMLGWMQAHARYIERYLSHYFSPNTHLTGEALGLYYIGTLLPELQGADRWRELGKHILEEQMERQVFTDGVYFEQSTSYQYYTVEIYLHFFILAQRNGDNMPSWMTERLGMMLDFLLAVRRPDNKVPLIGDTDGGWLLPLLRRSPGDHTGLFSTAALLLNNNFFAWAAGALAPETSWLLGSTAKPHWLLMQPERPRSTAMQCFREGGYVVQRSSWDRRAHHLIFDTGPLGCHVSGGHGHADLLSIQCSAFGEAYLVDPGTGCYTADPDWRNYFRSSHAHSTVLVDDHSQARPSGPFSWHERPVARLRRCSENLGYGVVDAEHAAYSSLADPVTHRRRVVFVDGRYWIVVDDLNGAAEHRIDLRFQFAALPVAEEAEGWTRARGKNSALLVKTFSPVSLDTTLCSAQLNPPAGWFSPNYGQRIEAPALSSVVTTRLPLRLVTVIFPVEDPTAQPPAVKPVLDQSEVTGLIVGTENRERVRIGTDKLSILRSISEWNF